MGLSIKIFAISAYRMQTRRLYESLIICILGIKLDNHGFKMVPSCLAGLSLFLHCFHLAFESIHVVTSTLRKPRPPFRHCKLLKYCVFKVSDSPGHWNVLQSHKSAQSSLIKNTTCDLPDYPSLTTNPIKQRTRAPCIRPNRPWPISRIIAAGNTI
jgi:hypothetical protein